MVITNKEVEVIWAALVSMVEENHQPQDNLTADQWVIAENLLAEVSAVMDKHDE